MTAQGYSGLIISRKYCSVVLNVRDTIEREGFGGKTEFALRYNVPSGGWTLADEKQATPSSARVFRCGTYVRSIAGASNTGFGAKHARCSNNRYAFVG